MNIRRFKVIEDLDGRPTLRKGEIWSQWIPESTALFNEDTLCNSSDLFPRENLNLLRVQELQNFLVEMPPIPLRDAPHFTRVQEDVVRELESIDRKIAVFEERREYLLSLLFASDD